MAGLLIAPRAGNEPRMNRPSQTDNAVPTDADIAALPDMIALRAAMDSLDREIARLIGIRSKIIDRASEIKAKVGLPARIDTRVEEVAAKARANAAVAGYDADLAEALWRTMMDHFIAQEARALGETDDR